jgi:peptidoglycan/LPS O-acetylase OafA/YrhL
MVWILLLIGYIVCLYDVQYWIYGRPYNKLISSLVYPTTRIIWAINTATLIWMCITGNGGLVNKFLSWKVFIPLSRLTYSVYLTHAWIVWIYWGSKRDLVDMNNFNILSLFSGIILMSYVLGAIFSLIFESPFLNLQKYLKDYLIGYEKDRIKTYISPSNFSESIDSPL